MISPSITVAVITYNRPERLARCLESIKDQIYPPEYILVEDDGGGDQESHDIAVDSGAIWIGRQRTMLRGEEIRNETRSINHAYDQAVFEHSPNNRIIAVVQADHILAPDYFLWLARAYTPHTVQIGLTHHVPVGGHVPSQSSLINAMHIPDGEARYEKYLLMGRRILIETADWFLMDGLDFALSPTCWLPFDPFFIGHGHGEMEWALRSMIAGVRFYINPMMRLWHPDKDESTTLTPKIQAEVKRSQKYLEEKYGKNVWGRSVGSWLGVEEKLRELRGGNQA